MPLPFGKGVRPSMVAPKPDEVLWTGPEDHNLDFCSTFTHHTVGYESLPEGGQKPIREPLPKPYTRWYCSCGVVGGKFDNEVAAELDHIRHAKDVWSGPRRRQ